MRVSRLFVGNGWQPFRKVYEASGPPFQRKQTWTQHPQRQPSQEISFDWRSGETGLAAAWPKPSRGHLFTVEAWAKYVPSESGLQLYLGIDPTGGEGF